MMPKKEESKPLHRRVDHDAYKVPWKTIVGLFVFIVLFGLSASSFHSKAEVPPRADQVLAEMTQAVSAPLLHASPAPENGQGKIQLESRHLCGGGIMLLVIAGLIRKWFG